VQWVPAGGALEAEKMLRQVFLNDPLIEKVSDQAVKEISPMRTSLHSPAYKRKMEESS